MKYLNCTPHDITLNNGTIYFALPNLLVRVTTEHTPFVDGVCIESHGTVSGLPDPQEGVIYIVSAIVLAACKGIRTDLVAPATSHPETVRDEEGHIVSVPGFVKYL